MLEIILISILAVLVIYLIYPIIKIHWKKISVVAISGIIIGTGIIITDIDIPTESYSTKWSIDTTYNTLRSLMMPLAVDINDDGIMEIFIGGTVDGILTKATMMCINGSNGNIIWQENISGSTTLDFHIGAAIADLNNDGTYEIVYTHQLRTIARNCEDGSIFWNVSIPSGWHYLAVADVDGTGYPYVYTTYHNSGGTTTAYKLNGTTGTSVASATVKYSCYGGVSIADVDRDGNYEVFISDTTGYGLHCLDSDLNFIWNDTSSVCECFCIMLRNVTGDENLEIFGGSHSTNSLRVLDVNGDLLLSKASIFDLHPTPLVADVDNDGNYEWLDGAGNQNTTIYDLVTETVDGYLGVRVDIPPMFANIDDDNGNIKELIIFDGWYTGVRVFNEDFTNTHNFAAGEYGLLPLVQDVDDDGLNEIVIFSDTADEIICYNTDGVASSPLPRSDHCYYTERRIYEDTYIPAIGAKPSLSSESPTDTDDDVSMSITQLSVTVTEPDDDDIVWTIETSPDIGSNSGSGSDGEITCDISGLESETEYTWWVNSSDTTNWGHQEYTFTTGEDLFSLKWSCDIPYYSESPMVAEDTDEDGIYEIYIGGRNGTRAAGAGNDDGLVRINGSDGTIDWDMSFSYSGVYVPCAIGDLNDDGTYEIVHPFGSKARALNCEDGSDLWNITINGGWGQPAIVDLDGTGIPYVILAGNTGYSGNKLNKLYGNNGTVAATTNDIYYCCHGGVSVADLDRDGEYEIFMSDSGDSHCFDEDLTELWTTSSFTSETHAGMLINVTGDADLEVILCAQDQTSPYDGGIYIYYANGTLFHGDSTLGLAIHSQPSVHDIDLDGNVELMVRAGTDYGKVWDLIDWSLDATLEHGVEPGEFANVCGDSNLEIIDGAAFDDDYVDLYNDTYTNIYINEITTYGLSTLVQDIDNDGYNEIIFNQPHYNNDLERYENGKIVCWDTTAPAASPSLRTDTSHYSERRLSSGVYIPKIDGGCTFASESPTDTDTDVSIETSSLSVTITDPTDDVIYWTIETSPNIGSDSGSGEVDGVKTCTVSDLESSTEYTWYINVTDGSNYVFEEYTFTTESASTISQTIRNTGEDYFTWVGNNVTAFYVAENITNFNEATEYIAIWNNDTWDSTRGLWNRTYADDIDSNNWTIHTFDVVQVYLTDTGTQTIEIVPNPDMNFLTTRVRTLAVTENNYGYNYTGYYNTGVSTLSDVADNTNLVTGEVIAWWDDTNYEWCAWIVGFSTALDDKNVNRYDIFYTSVSDTRNFTID